MNKRDDIKRGKQGFQTPFDVCRYMASLIPDYALRLLEPTPGSGNLVNILKEKNPDYDITAPEDFFQMNTHERFDCVVMNPPFASSYAFGVPEHLNKAGMRLGYHILLECMRMSHNVIALVPWFTLSDSDIRLRTLTKFGLKSVTALPRKTFQFARIQTVILELEKGYRGKTDFIVYDLIKHIEQPKLFANAE